MSDWQPIESAPKDGTWILVWDPYRGHNPPYDVVQWRNPPYDVVKWRHGWSDGDTRLAAPSHWQPLPSPPLKKIGPDEMRDITNVAIRKVALEGAAALIASFSEGQIRLAAGEMTAQEMRTVKAVQAWWAAAIRHKALVP